MQPMFRNLGDIITAYASAGVQPLATLVVATYYIIVYQPISDALFSDIFIRRKRSSATRAAAGFRHRNGGSADNRYMVRFD